VQQRRQRLQHLLLPHESHTQKFHFFLNQCIRKNRQQARHSQPRIMQRQFPAGSALQCRFRRSATAPGYAVPLLRRPWLTRTPPLHSCAPAIPACPDYETPVAPAQVPLATPLAAPLPVSALRCFIPTIQGLWAYSSSSRCLDQIPRAD
jgi:hypothetical protein